jgi:hypothetical protein
MADTLRVRGAEVQVRLTRNGVLEKTLTAVKSFQFEAMLEIKQEGYLGESNDRFDDIYKGCSGNLTFHPESQDVWTLMAFIRDRAARRSAQADHHVNLKFVCNLPDGTRPSITIPDAKFSNIPLNAPQRDGYLECTLTFNADDFTIQTT